MITLQLTKEEVNYLKRGLVEYEVRLESFTDQRPHIKQHLKNVEELYLKIAQAK